MAEANPFQGAENPHQEDIFNVFSLASESDPLNGFLVHGRWPCDPYINGYEGNLLITILRHSGLS